MCRDEARLLDMLIWSRRAVSYTADIDVGQFLEDTLVQDAVTRCLQVVGDAASHVSEDFRADHPAISWFEIRGMRNRLVHEYGAIDPRIVFGTATSECRRLIQQLEPLVPADRADPTSGTRR